MNNKHIKSIFGGLSGDVANEVPNENADNPNAPIKKVVSIGGTTPDSGAIVHIGIGDIYPSLQEIAKYIGTFKYADAWRKYWQLPMEFNPQAYASSSSASACVVTLPAMSDQRHVIEQIIVSAANSGAFTLTIQDGADTIYTQRFVFSDTNGGWDYVTFSPQRMQRVPNQPLVITFNNGAAGGNLFVNSWRF